MRDTYHFFQEIVFKDLSDQAVDSRYEKGFVMTRLGKGIMHQVRSLRLDLGKFVLSSENRRVLKKSEQISCSLEPLPYRDYHWSIGKMASDFYTEKFGDGTMSANKVKEMFTDLARSNMNSVFVYTDADQRRSNADQRGYVFGYCLTFQTKNIIHYAYPFYDLSASIRVDNQRLSAIPLGMSMMLKAAVLAQELGKKYLYLGSVHNEKALYKLQFEGLEWWDKEANQWNSDLERLKGAVRD